MEKKEDLSLALNGGQPQEAVPLWELEFQLWDAFSCGHVVLGREFESLSKASQQKALVSNAEIFLSVCSELEFSALTVPGGYWEIAPGKLAYYCLPDGARFEQFKILRRMAPDDLMLAASIGMLLTIPESGPYVEFCHTLFDAPDQVDRMAQQVFESGTERMKKFSDEGLDIIVSPSDIADNHGLFFNPQQLQRFIFPYLNKWTQQAKQLGFYSILHTDGNVTDCLEAIADTDLNALQGIDPVAGMNIKAVKGKVGDRLCLCGNIDCGLLLTGTEQQVYDSAKELLLSCKEGGSLVLGASNALEPDAPTGNYSAMINAWKDHGKY
jgi:uroporphyrinogen decarboxylase